MSEQLDMMGPSAPKEATSKALPSLVEFKMGGEFWRCARFDLLATEFELKPQQLGVFSMTVSARERSWMIVRRLFGLAPVIPPPGTSLDDMRLWNREELRTALGLSRAQLQAELETVRGAWMGVAKSLAPEPAPTETKRAMREEFLFSDEEILAKHGFTIRFATVEEKAWFASRVRDYEKVLQEKFAAGLARNALMSELRIHQLDDLLNDPEKSKPGGSEWKASLKLRQELDSNYQDQITQIKELCPWAGAIAGKFTFTGVLSDITKAIQEYQSRNDTRLIDGIFSATEIQVECRRSTQAPDPRYRAGLVTYLNAAKAGLWDPHWKPAFEPVKLKRIDAAFKAALVAAGEESGERLPDLEQDGPGGEYPELQPAEGSRQEPSENEQNHQKSPPLHGAA